MRSGALRIGIDAHILGKRKGGVETCLLSIVRTLARLDSENEYFVYVTDKCLLQQSELPANFHLRRLWAANPWLGRLLLLPYWYRADRLDMIHVQRVVPLWGCARTVLHLHDATHLAVPSLFPRWKRLIFTKLFRWSGHSAAMVITPSECAKTDLVRYYGITADKIAVVRNGIDPLDFRGSTQANALNIFARRFGLGESYAICIGAIERHKNLALLVDAFQLFEKRHPGFQLVIAGTASAETRSGYLHELQQRVADLNLTGKVVFTGHVPSEELKALLAGARMLVFPSIAEGFGFPPLEAMACGVPAVTANTPVSHEVYGDAVLRCHPDDPSHLAGQMSVLAADTKIAASYIGRGTKLLTAYRWENSCAKLMDAYRRVVAR